MEKQWVGKVIDRMTGEIVYQTKKCTTWEDAQKKADKKKYQSDRYRINVN